MTLEEAIQHLDAVVKEVQLAALQDDKTPLFNGLALGKALQAIGKLPQPQAFIYGDLNGFKDINTKYGHDGGDAALGEAGRALKKAVENFAATAFRQSGDEFAVLCPLDNIKAVEQSLESTFRSLVVEFNSKQFEIRMSFGWTRIVEAESSIVWKERAELACAVAKQRGPGISVEWTSKLVTNNKEERRRCRCGCSFRAGHESFSPESVLFCPKCGERTGAEIRRNELRVGAVDAPSS